MIFVIMYKKLLSFSCCYDKLKLLKTGTFLIRNIPKRKVGVRWHDVG